MRFTYPERIRWLTLRPDLDKFLFAAVEDEIDGIRLSMISALSRLGLDPWQEAGRLSSLARREARELALVGDRASVVETSAPAPSTTDKMPVIPPPPGTPEGNPAIKPK